MNEQQELPKPKPRLGTGFLLGIIAIVATIVISIAIGWWGWPSRSIGGWTWWSIFMILMGGLIAVVLAGTRALREFITRYREQRFLAALRAEEKQAPVEGMEGDQRRLREKMQDAIRTLQQSPELRKKGGLPLYAVPWYLLIGASQSGKTTLLRSVASSFAPFERPSVRAEAAPTQSCDWWFFNTAIILDTAGSYAFPAKGERDSAQWFRFLQLLRHYRELLPINGLIITVGADTLASKPQEELRLEAGELRKRIDEAIRELGVDFPIYILITRCDLIEGFTEFFGCLPEHVQRQVFGYAREMRLGATLQPSETASVQRLEAGYEQVVERLEQLRLSIFNGEKLPPATLRQRIYGFPEEFRALHQPLNAFVEALLAENPFQYKPFFRALFFSSAQQQGTPRSFVRRQLHFDHPVQPLAPGTRPYFLHDLLAVILRRDQYLARRTGRSIRWRLFRNLSLFSGGVALCLLLLLLLTWTFFSDRRALASVNQEPCAAAAPGQQGAAPLLQQAEGCRQVVQGLIDLNRQRFTLSNLVFNRSGRLAGKLRQRYVEKFHSEVLAPLDAGVNQQLTASPEAVPWVFSLIKRLELINRCLSGFRCPNPIAEDMQPDYRLMLTAASRRPPSPAEVATLRNTYEAYLYWATGSEEVLRQEQAAHADRLRQWFSAKQFAPQQILQWANQRYAPVTMQTFWKEAGSGDGRRGFQVDGAYTLSAWKQSILPLLQRAADAIPELDPRLREFREEYRRQYFEQWQRFLADFSQGELPWWRTREQRRQLALRLLDEGSPYNRAIDATFDELKPLLPAMMVAEAPLSQSAQDTSRGKFGQLLSKAWQTVRRLWARPRPSIPENATATDMDRPIPVWAHTLQHYIRSEDRKAYVSALKEVRQQLGEDVPMEKSFQLALAGFQEGRPSEKSTHPVFKAWWILSQFREKAKGSEAALDTSFWPLLERPVLIAWKVILEGSAEFLQKTWAESVVAPTKGLSELEQADFLYGPQGKVREFVDKFVKPFLTDNESRLGQALGEEMPLGPAFFKVLKDEKQLKPSLGLARQTPYRVRVEVAPESVINSKTSLVEEKTEFQIECEARAFKASNRPKEGTEASTTVFWSPDSCSDATVTVSMACDQRCVERATAIGIPVPALSSSPISRRYKGQAGFLRFLQEFSGGSRTFTLGDFADSYPPSEWQRVGETLRRYQVSSIRVSLRTDVPPSLTTLISVLPALKPPAAITKQ